MLRLSPAYVSQRKYSRPNPPSKMVWGVVSTKIIGLRYVAQTHSWRCPASQPCVSVVCKKLRSPHTNSRKGASTGFGAVGWEAYVEWMRRTTTLRNLNSIPDPLKRRLVQRRKEKIREKTLFPSLQRSLNRPSSCSTTAKLRAIFGLVSCSSSALDANGNSTAPKRSPETKA